MSNLRPEEQDLKIPVPAVVLGTAGLIPFLFLTGALLSGSDLPSMAARAVLVAYSIAILSFMGAVHWGLAMNSSRADQSWRRYFVSVIPALAATATVFIDGRVQFIWLAVCFLGLLAYDLYAVRRGEAPPWYWRLRWQLTLIVCASLGVASLQGGASV